MKRLLILFVALMAAACVSQQSPQPFKVLVLAENGGHHIAFTKAAKPWLEKYGRENEFQLDYITNTLPITKTFLANYKLILQLDYVPYGWTPVAQEAFKDYIENGRGGWVGLHHASLLGDFDGQKMWPWFCDFMGGIKFKNYIPKFTSGTVHVEDPLHPIFKGVPETFAVSKEEWYTYDRSPRPNIHVLASVDESTYTDPSAPRMGDHPVVWTNPRVAARNVYIFMGHGPWLFENDAYTKILRNAILWAAQKDRDTDAFNVLAFYTGKFDKAHISFVREANRWFPQMAEQNNFHYRATTNWNELNAQTLSNCQVVIFLDTRPDETSQRAAFRKYMDAGGAWMGFHFAAFALTPSEYPQNWDWYHNDFLGSGSYVGNTWRPTAAVLRVENRRHPATADLPETFQSAPNEWYKWSNDLRTNSDIEILLSIDPASFPLGTGPKPYEIWHKGYYPVVWTNKRYHMVYFNMGHNDIDYEHKTDKELSHTFDNATESRLILDSLLWLGRRNR